MTKSFQPLPSRHGNERCNHAYAALLIVSGTTGTTTGARGRSQVLRGWMAVGLPGWYSNGCNYQSMVKSASGACDTSCGRHLFTGPEQMGEREQIGQQTKGELDVATTFTRRQGQADPSKTPDDVNTSAAGHQQSSS
ncbi:unnamed protein product [Protopolystoma xenopodis]|uniref:Uncharacterized protein n=1 Tax=Protopolystoma xenopodis TaxID=117903 RepID=A0A448XJY0_9PLAT|nr:unnamed protein product [Protopolystoma xenopodis]